MYKLLIFLIWILLSNNSFANYKIEIVPAWDGEVRTGRITELSISILSPVSDVVNFSVLNSKSQQTISFKLKANILKREWLPVLPSKSEPLIVTAHSRGAEIYRTEIKTRPEADTEHIVAILLAGQNHITGKNKFSESNDINIIYPGHQSLPRHFQAYNAIDALIVDKTLLQHIDDHQLNALMGYIANCGRLFILQANAKLMTILINNAGCGAQNIQNFDSLDDALQVFTSNYKDYLPYITSVLDAQSISESIAHSQTKVLIIIFFSIYFSLLLFLPLLTKKPAVSLAAVLLICGFMFLYGTNRQPDIKINSWSEAFSSDSAARYSALVQIDGKGKNKGFISLPDKFGLPVGVNAVHPVKLISSDIKHEYKQLFYETSLLSRDQYLVHGLYKHRASLNIILEQDNIIIQNTSGTKSLTAVLNWKNDRYLVPALEPDEKWVPPEQHSTWPDNAIERLFRKNTANDAAALLIKNDSDYFVLENQAIQTQDWLIIRKNHTGRTV